MVRDHYLAFDFFPTPHFSRFHLPYKEKFRVGRWVAKLVAHLLASAALAGFESRHLSKIPNGRHISKGMTNTL
jgi:hypothetical protein